MVTVIHVTLAEAAAALATTAVAAAKAADLVIKTESKSDTDIADLQTQLIDRPYPKPDVVSSAVFHTDTDDDYDDAGDEGRDEDSKSSSRKPAVKVKEEDLEVEEGETYSAVDHSSFTDRVKHPKISISDWGEKKRDLQPNHSNSSKQVKKRQKIVDAFTIDLSDVPPQLPISKHADRFKEGASKYAGACYDKIYKKWKAGIWIEGKQWHIGNYENEEEAAVDYARAVFKYKGQGVLDKARKRNSSAPDAFTLDLSDVPPHSPIPKSSDCVKDGTSKYQGVCFDKSVKKWKARIRIDGKLRHIGYYENEEEAAADYARAVFKYKGSEALAQIMLVYY